MPALKYWDPTTSTWVSAQGPQGPQGPAGTGAQGPQGADSTVQGPQGAPGAQGATGTGVQGAQGDEGLQGPQGAQGADVTGPQGNQGAAGMPGNQGPQGVQGAQGLNGIPVAGAPGQMLVKLSATDYDTEWASEVEVYTGATAPSPQDSYTIWLDTSTTEPGNAGPQGPQGAQGTQGVQGAQGSIAPGTETSQLAYWDGSSWQPTGPGGSGTIPYWDQVNSQYAWTPGLGPGNQGLVLYWDGTQWNYFGNALGPGNANQAPVWNGSSWTVQAVVNSIVNGGGLSFSASNGNVSAQTITAAPGSIVATGPSALGIVNGITDLGNTGPLSGTWFLWGIVSISSAGSTQNVQALLSTSGTSMTWPNGAISGQQSFNNNSQGYYGNLMCLGYATFSGESVYLILWSDQDGGSTRGIGGGGPGATAIYGFRIA